VIYSGHKWEKIKTDKKEGRVPEERLENHVPVLSFQSTGKPASGRKEKKRERKCGKVTLDGDVGGICRRRTFWKVVG